MISCIYKIYFHGSDKFYIGSTKNLNRRIYEHLKLLNNNKHPNIIMQKAYTKYGKENFRYDILNNVISNTEILLKVEQWYLDYYKPSYNIAIYSHCSATTKVTDILAEEIINKRINNVMSVIELHKEYPQISCATIGRVLYDNNYKNNLKKGTIIDQLNIIKHNTSTCKRKYNLTNDDISYIKWYIDNNYSITSISKVFNIPRIIVQQIKGNILYKGYSIKQPNVILDLEKINVQNKKPFVIIKNDAKYEYDSIIDFCRKNNITYSSFKYRRKKKENFINDISL